MSKVMLVEDDKSLREIYSIRLVAEGYDIVSASDGEEGLALAVKEKPDLIIADVMMPKISGFDMLDILRSTPETAGVKVIMMTALSSDDQRQRGEALGANRYLVKSQVGIEDVVNTVHELLEDSPNINAGANLDTVAAIPTRPATADAPAIPGYEANQAAQMQNINNAQLTTDTAQYAAVPAAPVAPAAPEAPMVAQPVMSEAAAQVATDAMQAAPQMVAPQMPQMPTIPEVPAPAAPVVPGVAQAPVAPEMPTVPAMPAVPTAPAVPATPIISEAPVAPVAPEAPSAPVAPAAPTIPTAPVAPAAPIPAAPVTPAAPAAPAAPVAPVTATAPVAPETPAMSATPIMPEAPTAAASALPEAPATLAAAPTIGTLGIKTEGGERVIQPINDPTLQQNQEALTAQMDALLNEADSPKADNPFDVPTPPPLNIPEAPEVPVATNTSMEGTQNFLAQANDDFTAAVSEAPVNFVTPAEEGKSEIDNTAIQNFEQNEVANAVAQMGLNNELIDEPSADNAENIQPIQPGYISDLTDQLSEEGGNTQSEIENPIAAAMARELEDDPVTVQAKERREQAESGEGEAETQSNETILDSNDSELPAFLRNDSSNNLSPNIQSSNTPQGEEATETI